MTQNQLNMVCKMKTGLTCIGNELKYKENYLWFGSFHYQTNILQSEKVRLRRRYEAQSPLGITSEAYWALNKARKYNYN